MHGRSTNVMAAAVLAACGLHVSQGGVSAFAMERMRDKGPRLRVKTRGTLAGSKDLQLSPYFMEKVWLHVWNRDKYRKTLGTLA